VAGCSARCPRKERKDMNIECDMCGAEICDYVETEEGRLCWFCARCSGAKVKE